MWLVILVALLGIYKATGELWDRHVENVLGMEPASFPVYNIYVGFNEETQGQWSAEDMDLLFSYLSRPGATTSEAQEEMLPHLKERLSSGIDFGRLFASKLIAFMGNDELYPDGAVCQAVHGDMQCVLLRLHAAGNPRHICAPAQLAAKRVPAAAAVYAGAHAGTYAGRGLKPVPLLDNSRHHNIGRLCTGRQ